MNYKSLQTYLKTMILLKIIDPFKNLITTKSKYPTDLLTCEQNSLFHQLDQQPKCGFLLNGIAFHHQILIPRL